MPLKHGLVAARQGKCNRCILGEMIGDRHQFGDGCVFASAMCVFSCMYWSAPHLIRRVMTDACLADSETFPAYYRWLARARSKDGLPNMATLVEAMKAGNLSVRPVSFGMLGTQGRRSGEPRPMKRARRD